MNLHCAMFEMVLRLFFPCIPHLQPSLVRGKTMNCQHLGWAQPHSRFIISFPSGDLSRTNRSVAWLKCSSDWGCLFLCSGPFMSSLWVVPWHYVASFNFRYLIRLWYVSWHYGVSHAYVVQRIQYWQGYETGYSSDRTQCNTRVTPWWAYGGVIMSPMWCNWC